VIPGKRRREEEGGGGWIVITIMRGQWESAKGDK